MECECRYSVRGSLPESISVQQGSQWRKRRSSSTICACESPRYDSKRVLGGMDGTDKAFAQPFGGGQLNQKLTGGVLGTQAVLLGASVRSEVLSEPSVIGLV